MVPGERVPTRSSHMTGCSLSPARAAGSRLAMTLAFLQSFRHEVDVSDAPRLHA